MAPRSHEQAIGILSKQSDTQGIVVLGAPRSGTTLLRRLLDAHPHISNPPESFLLSACARFLHEDQFPGNPAIGVLTGLGFLGFEADDVITRLREFAFSFQREHAARAGKRRWVEKTAFDIFHLHAIERLTAGHVQYLCMRRHGLDVVCSLDELVGKTGGYVREIHEYIQRHQSPLDAYAHIWMDADQSLSRFLERHPDDALEVRYESLVDAPEDTLDRIGAFLDETWSPAYVEAALSSRDGVGFGDWKTYGRPSIDKASVDRWRALPRATLDHLARLMNPTLEAAGYTPVDPADEPTSEEAKRRLEVAMMLQGMKKGEPPPD
jgi:protein-tyrosine sulfotransferase